MEAPPAADDMEAELQELRTTKGKTGFKGIIVAKPGTAKPYLARVDDVVTGQKQRPIPGLFKDAEEAARSGGKLPVCGSRGTERSGGWGTEKW